MAERLLNNSMLEESEGGRVSERDGERVSERIGDREIIF